MEGSPDFTRRARGGRVGDYRVYRPVALAGDKGEAMSVFGKLKAALAKLFDRMLDKLIMVK